MTRMTVSYMGASSLTLWMETLTPCPRGMPCNISPSGRQTPEVSLLHDRDCADLDEIVGRHQLGHLDHGRRRGRELEVLAAHLVDLVEVLDVAHVDVDAADVVHGAAGGLDRSLEVLAHLAGLPLDVADRSDGAVGAPRGHAGDEDQLALGVGLDRLREVPHRLAHVVGTDLAFRHAGLLSVTRILVSTPDGANRSTSSVAGGAALSVSLSR